MKPLYQILTETQETQESQIPRIETLEADNTQLQADNAELFYQNMLLEADNADLWYEVMTGGM